MPGPRAPQDDLLGAVEIIKDKLYIAAVRTTDNLPALSQVTSSVCFSIDNKLLYEPFFTDFGPLNLGLTYRFCKWLDMLLENQKKQPEGRQQKVVFCCANDPYRKANAATLIGVYCTLYLGQSADDAYKPLTALKPFAPFRDASCGTSTFHLTVLDCIRGMEKAKAVGFIDFHLREGSTFNLEEYEHFEQVENGDLNWILPGKFIAFSGPSAKRTEFYGYRTLVPEDYWDFFHKAGVTAVVRLNKKMYDKRRFTDGGFRLHDLYFPDGSTPSEAILRRFIELAEAEPGVLCVHCKAGLGRTGVLICCYIMKHYKFTANEVIGYIRICRPGSVIGPQQHYLKEMEQKCWRWGDQYRAQMQAQNSRVPNMLGDANCVDDGEEESVGAAYQTSPVKPMRSGTRPSGLIQQQSNVAAVASRMSSLGFSQTPSQVGGGSGSGYRGVGSGAAAVAAANGTMGNGARLRSLGGAAAIRDRHLSNSVPLVRRSKPTHSGLVRRTMAAVPTEATHDAAAARAGAPGRSPSNSRGVTPGGLSREQQSISAGIAGATGGMRTRTSSAGPSPGSPASPSPPNGMAGGSSFTGRIVTASGQPRKGAAAAAAAMSSGGAYGGRSYGAGVPSPGSPYTSVYSSIRPTTNSAPLRSRS